MADYQTYDGTPGQAQPASYPDPVSSPAGAQGSALPAAAPVKDTRVILRAVQLLCDIIVMGCAAGSHFGLDRLSSESFILFTSAVAFILDLFFIVTYLLGAKLPGAAFFPKIEIVVSPLWALFYFAGGIAYAVNANSYQDGRFVTGKSNAVTAFAIISSFLWAGTSFLAIKRSRAGAAAQSGAGMSYNDI